MRQILLAIILIAIPVTLFSAIVAWQSSHAAAPAPLGDLSAFAAIVTDVQAIAAKGDLNAAETRVTDFETVWDDKEATLRPMNKDAWGNVDDAADRVFKALRAKTPVAGDVTVALLNLEKTLRDPMLAGTPSRAGAVQMVSGIAVSDENGRPLPCEDMLKALKTKRDAATLDATLMAQVNDFVTKATERCNADDDARADAFSAQGLGVVGR